MAIRMPQNLETLLYQCYETELGGEKIYQTALRCAIHEDFKAELTKYASETAEHVKMVRQMLEDFGLAPDADVPSRKPVRVIGQALVKAMEVALAECGPEAAELVAAECVVQAETKDHLNWELLEALCEAEPTLAKKLAKSVEQVEPQEDHHLYHTKGWCRELWLTALGQEAVLPPPEERKHVETAIGAERAKNAREQML